MLPSHLGLVGQRGDDLVLLTGNFSSACGCAGHVALVPHVSSSLEGSSRANSVRELRRCSTVATATSQMNSTSAAGRSAACELVHHLDDALADMPAGNCSIAPECGESSRVGDDSARRPGGS